MPPSPDLILKPITPLTFSQPFDRRSFGEPLKALRSVPIIDNGEPLVDLRDVAPELHLHPGCLPFLRESVAWMAGRVQALLPDGYVLTVGTCLRTMQNQRDIREHFTKDLVEKNPHWSKATLERTLNRMIAPTEEPRTPPPHTTGAALDIGMRGPDGQDLDFTSPHEGWVTAPTCYHKLSETARNNRIMLIEVMHEAGLTNYVGEWWHWSWGDQGWALRTGHPVAFYGPVELEDAESKRVPKPPEDPVADTTEAVS